MKTNIEVKDRREGDAIRTALDDPTTRAMVICVGLLMPLSERARKRVLNFVMDKLEDPETKVTDGGSA